MTKCTCSFLRNCWDTRSYSWAMELPKSKKTGKKIAQTPPMLVLATSSELAPCKSSFSWRKWLWFLIASATARLFICVCVCVCVCVAPTSKMVLFPPSNKTSPKWHKAFWGAVLGPYRPIQLLKLPHFTHPEKFWNNLFVTGESPTKHY